MPAYSMMTQEEYEGLLAEILKETPAADLLAVPEIFEAVAKHFDKEVHKRWAAAVIKRQSPEAAD